MWIILYLGAYKVILPDGEHIEFLDWFPACGQPPQTRITSSLGFGERMEAHAGHRLLEMIPRVTLTGAPHAPFNHRVLAGKLEF